MERTQDVDVLSEDFPHLESAVFSSSNEKCSSAKVTDKLLHQGSHSHSAKLGDTAAFLNSRNAQLDHLYNPDLVKMNSSLHNCEMNVHAEFDGKPTLSKFAGYDLMRHAGIGRGKQRDRVSPVSNIDMNQLKPLQVEYETNVENNPVSNSVDFPELKSIKIVSDLEAGKVSDLSKRTDIVNNTAPKGSHVHSHGKTSDSHFRDNEMKNIRNTIDQYSREHDLRRMQNGFDSNKGNKGKPFRMSRYPNNSGSSVQFKYDSRPLQHFPIANNMKPPRTMKNNEGYYRQNDSRRNQSSKPPFPTDIDKIMYSKSRSNICSDIPGYNPNRNSVHNYPINKAEINSLMQMPESYVPRDLSAFKRRSFVSKNDHVHNSKQWTSSRFHSEYVGPTGCHRNIPVPNKSYENKHPVTGLTSEKNANNCAFVSKTNSRDSEALEHEECSHSCDKEPSRLKANCSSCHFGNKQYSISHGNVNLCIDGNSNLSSFGVATNFQTQTSANDQAGDSNFSHCPSLRDVSLTEKSQYTSGQFSCDSQCEHLSSHPKNNECISIPDQPLVKEAMQCPISYSNLNCSSGSQASYADIMRSPAVGSSKVALSQVFLHSSNGISKTEVPSALVQDIPLPKETDQSSSSEWIISRLSQVNANVDSSPAINGTSPHHTSNNPDGMHPRPIAVSVEKPSFYNTSLGVGKGLSSLGHQSSLSSPEKRSLECQLAEEHLCNLLTGKKTDLPVAPSSPGENSSNTACANIRTDSIFSDSSSVCSSSSSIFKTEIQQQIVDAKEVAPPVVIMKNCMPSSNVSDISFGIEMDEIMQICSDSSGNSKTDSSSISDSDLSLSKPVNTNPDEKDNDGSNSVNVNFLIVGGKRFLWKETDLDSSRCNLGHIMDFLQDAWHSVEIVADVDGKDSSDAIKYYNAE